MVIISENAEKTSKDEVSFTETLKNISQQLQQRVCSKINQKHTQLNLSSFYIDSLSIIPIVKMDFSYLLKIHLSCNKLGVKGCKYLSQLEALKLQQISLAYNNIQSEGVLHLSKGNWKHLLKLGLSNNNICIDGIKWISKAWNSLQQLGLSYNLLQIWQIQHLLVMQQKNITYFSASSNKLQSNEKIKLRSKITNKFKMISLYF